MLFSGKNIIVTGATGDLGVAIVQRLVSQGASVPAVAGFEAEKPRLAGISGPGAVETVVADVSDAKQVRYLVTRPMLLRGGARSTGSSTTPESKLPCARSSTFLKRISIGWWPSISTVCSSA